MPTPSEAKTKAATTYNAAADAYDLSANSFWDRFGRRTIARLDLSPGARCLDVCCGSGASAIPAAKKVAPHGSVLGVDLAEGLLELARAKAACQGLENIEFRAGDMLDLGLPDGHFDTVVCVFGIFLSPICLGRSGNSGVWSLQVECSPSQPGGRISLSLPTRRFGMPSQRSDPHSTRLQPLGSYLRPRLSSGHAGRGWHPRHAGCQRDRRPFPALSGRLVGGRSRLGLQRDA